MRVLLLALAATSLAAVTTPALAQNVGLKSYPNLDVTGFSRDATALPTAVSNVETLSGGRVVEIRYDYVNGVPTYDVVLLQGSQVRFLRFSRPGAAPLQLTETTTPAWMLDWRSKKNVDWAQDAKVGLADAIRTAEAANNGAPAVAAGIAHGAATNASNEVHAYNVLLLKGDSRRRVAVNSDSGAMIANPDALAEW